MWRGGLGGCCCVGLILFRGEKGKGAIDSFEYSASVAWVAMVDVSSVQRGRTFYAEVCRPKIQLQTGYFRAN